MKDTKTLKATNLILFQDGMAKLIISPVLSSHSGHIKCTLQNSVGKASHEARIYVRCKLVA